MGLPLSMAFKAESGEILILGMCRYYSWSSICGGAADEAGVTGCSGESRATALNELSGVEEPLGYIKHPGSGQKSG